MKINNINQQQNNQNFKGVTSWIAKNPKAATGIAALAGSSVVAQKIVMSGSEAVIGPVMDVGIGQAITKATGETDGRTNESSKVQAIRTFSQSVGGTIIGVIIRLACIGAATAACGKVGSKIGKIVTENFSEKDLQNAYKVQENASKWGKNIGGALATAVMLVTNFIIDAPFINWINKKTVAAVDKFENRKANNPQQPKPQVQAKEVK